MKKMIMLLSLIVLLSGCGAKQKSSQDFLHGSRLYHQFQESYLSGDPKLADYNFYKAEAQFQRVDGICNLSRIYIGRYVIQETENDIPALEMAKKYAETAGCAEELNAVNFFMKKDFKAELLPEPYKSINGLSGEKLIKAAESDKFDDITKTRLLRKAAIDYIMTNPALSEDVAGNALAVDKLHGWSLNILRDLIIMKNACEKQNKDCRNIETRIELVRTQVIKK